jgi:anti-sigma factor RsiW
VGISVQHPRQELLAYVEGRLDQAGRVRVSAHLADCPRCRAEAAELMDVTDSLNALPAALRGLSERQAGSWSMVWGRVQSAPIRRMVPQLNLYLSLTAVVFVLAAALPAGLGAQPLPVMAGAIQTPVALPVTPVAGKVTAGEPVGQVSTALAASRLPRGARAVPNPTPVPGQRG